MFARARRSSCLREPHYDTAGRPVLLAINYHNSDIVQFTLTRAGLRS